METTTSMENLDQAEIKRFEKDALRWWDLDGPARLLHKLNPLRVQYVTDTVCIRNKYILDVGCGGGILSETLAKRGAKRVTGIDASSLLIDVAEKHAASARIENLVYEVTTVESFAQTLVTEDTPPNPLFDVVTCFELLEHVPNPLSLIQACANLVKPGGDVFFSTLNRTLKSFLLAIVGAEYILEWLPKKTHHYEKFITPSELADGLREAGLTLKEVRGIKVNPFTQSASFAKEVGVNYIVHAIREK